MNRQPGLLSVMLLFLAAMVAGCYADPGDDEPSIGNVERNETVTAANLAIVSDGQGNAVLVGTLVNNGDAEDRLVDVDVESESGPVEVDLVNGPVELPVEEPVRSPTAPRSPWSLQGCAKGFGRRWS